MTAEVAIANGSAVALAADSAVTIGGRKIYNSAIKLFSLSKLHPVGIMIYGNANLLEVPWETLIKTCRQKLGTEKFETLEDYGDFFIKFIKDSKKYFSEDSQKSWVQGNVTAYFEMIRDELDEKVHPIFEKDGEVDYETAYTCFRDIVIGHHQELKERELSAEIDSNFEKLVKSKYKAIFKEVAAHVFQNLKPKPPLMAKLNDIATFLHTRSIYSNGTSGIVISGFGHDEIYPSILTYEIEGVIDGVLKFRKLERKSYKVTSVNDCSIVAFAQEDMVAAFMNGMNPSVNELINVYLNHIFSRLPDLLSDEELEGSAVDSDTIKKKLQGDAKTLHADFIDVIQKHIREQHISPVLNMVTALPKDELAAMAESLVNLTAFKRRMTESLETVGGPIDVAVISKGDGMVWVKRKLYFPKDINRHFFDNYFKGFEND
ncbi:hypothetical protein [Pseudidiomarina mangrovi]|uniref:hypothetical protein n=1 Tax=Pseudidiomarina mangrovi TaxID=2487133 RepID=UPI000FCAB092|nr:hypothetical protein [Pseudidiomarina mangrovi]